MPPTQRTYAMKFKESVKRQQEVEQLLVATKICRIASLNANVALKLPDRFVSKCEKLLNAGLNNFRIMFFRIKFEQNQRMKGTC